MKFKICANCDYVQGHLRYGHKETIVEAESREELEIILKDPEKARELFEDADTIVDDYEMDDYDCDYTDCYIDEEIKKDEYNYDYGIILLEELKGKLNNLQPSDTTNALNKAIELFKKRSDKK